MSGKHLLTEQYIQQLIGEQKLSDIIKRVQPNFTDIPKRFPSINVEIK